MTKQKGGAGMNWLKVGAIVVGGIIVFFVLDTAVHMLLSLLGAILFVAVIAGGGYVAFKIVGARRRRQVRRRPEDEAPRELEQRSTVVPPVASPPVTSQPARYDVDDELARLKREMGR